MNANFTNLPPLVVYHVAGMGDWKDVVQEQLALLREVGLVTDVRVTYLGDELEWLKERINHYGISAQIVRTSENLHHCETFAMMEIDQMAKVEKVERPILYMHTKGVSAPGNQSKRNWRLLMEAWVVRRWNINLNHLLTYDAVGVNWIEGGPQHFSGTFWIANPAWIKRLPDFVDYHNRSGLHRYTCELWVGAAQWCNALSLGCKNEPFWNYGYDYPRWMPSQQSVKDNTDVPPIDSGSPFGRVFDYHNSDKDSDHSYGEVYDLLFPTREARDEVTAIFEIGVHRGNSLMAWEHSFQNAAVYGMDTSANIDALGPRSRTAIADATCPTTVQNAMSKLRIQPESLDMIVDDGSHKLKDQLTSWAIFHRYLKPNGIYVIEDIYPAGGARILAEVLGGTVLDRRGEKNRFDDVLVITGKSPKTFESLQRPVDQDIPSPFPPV